MVRAGGYAWVRARAFGAARVRSGGAARVRSGRRARGAPRLLIEDFPPRGLRLPVLLERPIEQRDPLLRLHDRRLSLEQLQRARLQLTLHRRLHLARLVNLLLLVPAA
eukprot:5505977-Prymnesium_polylepis.1